MHEETRRTRIPERVKRKVYARDGGRCIVCGAPGLPNAHYIRRSQGGLGIEENVVTLCLKCHNDFDNGNHRREIGAWISEYLEKFYPEFDDYDRKYHKHINYQGDNKTR